VISKRISGRKSGKSSFSDALRYGEGLKPDRETGELIDKSHRTRLGNFGLVDDGIYAGQSLEEMAELIDLAAIEMQSNADLNTRVGKKVGKGKVNKDDKKLAHFVVSFDQYNPTEAVLRDTEDTMLSALNLDKNHFATFLHNDNGHYHLHIFASLIEKGGLHRGNPLWHDYILRDKVCREIEIRHGLKVDNGLHEVGVDGRFLEVPRDERIARRDNKSSKISDRAISKESYSGEKSFQTWVDEIKLGERLKHAKSWQDLHAAAAAYGCEIKAKGAGYVILPVGEKGGIQLSKIGLKNLPAKFGVFQEGNLSQQAKSEVSYKPEPTLAEAANHYDEWSVAKNTFKPIKTAQINEQREAHKLIRKNLQTQHKAKLEKIRANFTGQDRFAAVSLAKMEQSIALTVLSEQLLQSRQALYKQLAEQGPGNTFRDYINKEATKGDERALAIAQKYGVDDATNASRQLEANQLKIVAAVTGLENRVVRRLQFSHHVERSGTVIFNLGQGRIITDSITSKQVQLNNLAASSPVAIATALRFATAKYGNTLTLTGSAEFQRHTVEVAVKNNLGIKFADPVLENYRQSVMETQKNALSHRNQLARQAPPPHLRNGLHYLSDGDLVLNLGGDELPLQQDVPDDMVKGGETHHSDLQRADGRTSGTGSTRGTRTELPIATSTDNVDQHLTPAPSTRTDQAIIRPGGNKDRADGSLTENPSERSGLHADIEGVTTSIEAWRSENSEMVETKQLDGYGRVLHVFADGQWIQNRSKGRAFALQPKSNIEIKVGQNVTVAKDGDIKLITGQAIDR
jgi:Relaxase/Mobilisation nuclease domain/Large polyvalent protein-associated domain 7